MLTNIQEGMIAHYIWLRLETLHKYFFSVKKMTNEEEGYNEVAKIISIAEMERYEGKIYSDRSERVDVHEAIFAIQYELWGILHADRAVLTKLEIINSIRDTVRIDTEDDLKRVAPAIKECAKEKLVLQLQKHPLLLKALEDADSTIAVRIAWSPTTATVS